MSLHARTRHPQSIVAWYYRHLEPHLPPPVIYGEYVKLMRAGWRWKGICPFHPEKSPSFFVLPNRHYKCFGCGKGGDLLGFLVELERHRICKIVDEAQDIIWKQDIVWNTRFIFSDEIANRVIQARYGDSRKMQIAILQEVVRKYIDFADASLPFPSKQSKRKSKTNKLKKWARR